METACLFLATTMNRKQIIKQGLQDLIPKRSKKKGRRPGLSNPDITARQSTTEGEDESEENMVEPRESEEPAQQKVTFGPVPKGSKWCAPKRVPDEQEERRIIGNIDHYGQPLL